MAAAAPSGYAARRNARLAAVQALYQLELSGAPLESAIDDVRAGRLPLFEEGPLDEEVDSDLFRTIVEGVAAHQEVIDTLIARRLREGWRLERLDSVARAILRAGVAELAGRRDVPVSVAINEYVEVAKSYFDDEAEVGFINGLLDACGRAIRDDERGRT